MQKDNITSEHILLQLFVALGYATFAHVTHLFYAYNSITSLFWPSAGIAMAAVILGGARYLWGIAVGAAAINFYAAPGIVSALGITVGNILEPAFVAYMIHRSGRNMKSDLPNFSNYHALIGYTMVGSTISALTGPLTLHYDGIFATEEILRNILYWWMGDGLGVMIVVPLLIGMRKWNKKPFNEWADLFAFLIATVLIGLLVFDDVVAKSLPFNIAPIAEDYWLILVGLLVAARHGCVGSSTFLAVVAIHALVGTTSDHGYFAATADHSHLINYWGFMMVLSLVTTSIAIYIENDKVAKANARIAHMAFDSQEGMVVTDSEMRILKVNAAWCNITGYTEEEALGKTPRLLASGKHNREFYQNMWHKVRTEGRWSGEIINRRKDGVEYPEWLTISAVYNDNGGTTNYVGMLTDLSEEKQRKEELTRLSFYDYLTGLPNRRLLTDRLQHEVTSNIRSSNHGALMFLDLDNFKTINDTLGHDAGDELLKQVAVRIGEQLRREDTVARLGGDEFVVMLRDLSKDEIVAGRQARTIAEKILGAVSLPYYIKDIVHHGSVSVGVTLFNGDGMPVDELLKRADIAMYKVKQAGRNGISFFDTDMQEEINKRLETENGLRVALKEKQFELFYQPQYLEGKGIIGAEALIRWKLPSGRYVSPADFIPIAEDSGLILPIGYWVMHTAIDQLQRWHLVESTSHLELAVNVSGKQFYQQEFVADIIDHIERTNIDPSKLKLEITESVALEDIEATIAKIDELKQHGIRFSMDDFGTGQSSLSSLKKLPIDQLKIDQSFVRDIMRDPDDANMVQTIIAMARNLKLDVIAEGVETEEQREFLKSNDCTHYQGYLFSKPVPISEFNKLI